MESLMTTKEVADLLNVNIFTVRRLVAKGSLRAIRISTRGDLRFSRHDVDAFTSQRETVSV